MKGVRPDDLSLEDSWKSTDLLDWSVTEGEEMAMSMSLKNSACQMECTG